METEITWSNDRLSKLIKLFRKHENLWEHSHKDFRDKGKKNAAWIEIGKELGVSRHDAELKLHILRSQFSRERRRIVASQDGDVESKWKWFKPLMFLWDNMKHSSDVKPRKQRESRNSSDARSPNFIKLELDDSLSSPPSPTGDGGLEVNISPAFTISAQTTQNEIQEPNFDRTLRNEEETLATKTENPLVYATEQKRYRDEFDIYGQYVASELRHANNLRASLQAKHLINNVLINMRLGKYD